MLGKAFEDLFDVLSLFPRVEEELFVACLIEQWLLFNVGFGFVVQTIRLRVKRFKEVIESFLSFSIYLVDGEGDGALVGEEFSFFHIFFESY